MATVTIRAYLSPTLVLLAMDWPEGRDHQDFLGFAIKRTPGFKRSAESWLPNRIGFNGPAPNGADLPSNTSPIQKFLWWDARIDDVDRGKTFTYTITPVVGDPNNNKLLNQAANSVKVTLPQQVENGIGTYFNRAVVSSQAFIKEFGERPAGDQMIRAMAWLANGLEKVVPEFLSASHEAHGAIYHLTDDNWIIPAFEKYQGDASLVYDARPVRDKGGTKPTPNQPAIDHLDGKVLFYPRDKTNIMHDKFLVRLHGGSPIAVLMGSANFTPEGLTSQANLLHTWKSPELASLYWERRKLLESNPSLSVTAKNSGWSQEIQAGDATVRVFFPPEPAKKRESIDEIVKAVNSAEKSVVFCLFTPTDAPLLDAIFKTGDKGKMMFGLVNNIGKNPEENASGRKPVDAKVEIYHRSHSNKDVVGHEFFKRGQQPHGFSWEASHLPGGGKFPVYIHHKFIVIDAETDNPIIYTGSANMSNNAVHKNDENIMEIKGCPRVAAIYLAEFMRLYEHYRARSAWNNYESGKNKTFKLAPDSSWGKKAYAKDTPEYKARLNMVG
ncbi:MAG: phospholipase [Nitrospirae bacterium]|nr:phospholipase [Nitrospirota bacterium]